MVDLGKASGDCRGGAGAAQVGWNARSCKAPAPTVASRQPVSSALVKAISTSAPLEPFASPAARAAASAGEVA